MRCEPQAAQPRSQEPIAPEAKHVAPATPAESHGGAEIPTAAPQARGGWKETSAGQEFQRHITETQAGGQGG